jgi:hypothetical protein
MPSVAERENYNGGSERINRLGLQGLWEELEGILTGFKLLIEERRDANGGAEVRKLLDARFEKQGGWTKKQVGGVDWTKCIERNGTRICLGVEIQFSGRSDLLIVDIDHLREGITAGVIDVGVIVTPADTLSVYLTDRGPHFSAATRAIERARATDMPLIVLGLLHDGPGAALEKQRTRQGKRKGR